MPVIRLPTSKKNVATVIAAKNVHVVNIRRYTSLEKTATQLARKKAFMIRKTTMNALCSRRMAIQPMMNHGIVNRIDSRPTALKTGVVEEKAAIGEEKSCWVHRHRDARSRKAPICVMIENTNTH
jgi:hypothetical protein